MAIFLLLCTLLALGLHPAYALDAVPATSYFPVLPLDAPQDMAPLLIPLATNHALSGPHAGITRAILSIHDDSRDANAALGTLAALAGSENASTMILAPQFLLVSDLSRFADHLPDRGHAFAAWQMSSWPSGGDSTTMPGQGRGISSFTVVDLLLMYVSDRRSFPDLKTIIVAGYGTGGNFVQRYAAFNFAADSIDQQNIDLRFVVADLPSYLYLTAARPLGGRRGFGMPDVTQCPDYAGYPYGMSNLNAYARRIGANAAKTAYALRFITYLNALSPSAIADTTCAALTQGTDNLARATNYRLYLQSLYGDVATRTQTFSLTKDAKSDATGLFGSSCGMEVLFGDGLCPHIFDSKL